MNRPGWPRLTLFIAACSLFAPLARADGETQPGRDPKQAGG